MATLTTNSALQVDNFLKASGSTSGYDARRKLFSESGLGDRLGEFIGSDPQNNAIFRTLQQKAITDSTRIASEAARVAGLPAFQPGAEVTPTGIQQTDYGKQLSEAARGYSFKPGVYTSSSGGGLIIQMNPDLSVRTTDIVDALLTNEERVAAGNYGNQTALAVEKLKKDYGLDISTLPTINPADATSPSNIYRRILEDTGGNKELARQRYEKAVSAKSPLTISELINQAGGQAPAASAALQATSAVQQAGTPAPTGAFDLTQIPGAPETPSAADILAQARGSTDVQLAEQDAQIAKERIQTTLTSDLKTAKANLASRGLALSGFLTSQERNLRDEALAEELDVDSRFAKVLGNAIDSVQAQLGKDFDAIVDAAQANRKEEIAYLGQLGLAVNPKTGELTPTLAAQRAMASDERAEVQLGISQANLDIASAREDRLQSASEIQRQQADERIRLAEENLKLSRQREARIVSDLGVLKPSKTNVQAGLVGLTEEEANDVFTSEEAPDWFVEAEEYRRKYTLSPTLAQELWDKKRATAVNAFSDGLGLEVDSLINDALSNLAE